MKNKMRNRFNLSLPVTGTLLIILFFLLSGCNAKNQEKSASGKPAEVINAVSEYDLTTVHLSQTAENRLGIKTFKAETKDVPQVISAGGEIMAPPGQDVMITAPVNGTVAATDNGYFPVAGSLIEKGEPLMRLIIMPPEFDIVSATEAVRVKQVEYDLVLAEKERAEILYNNKAISEKNYESIKAQLARAEAELNAAKGKAGLYLGKDLEATAKNLSAYLIESPVSGVIQNIAVTPGQAVSTANILAEVTSNQKFWIRVPVFSGDLINIDNRAEAVISFSGSAGGISRFPARPVQGPQRSNPTSSSSDLYYEINNSQGIFRTGQKVSVVLTMKTTNNNIVVPYSSIIYDMYGGTWLYVSTEPLVYVRKRIEMSHIRDSMAVLTRGISPGEEVVINGVAELYGTEFGGGK